MADNVTIPASGTGTATPVVGTDDVGGVHYQQVKLVDPTLDSAVPLGVGNGTAATALRVALPTDGTGVVGLNAGTNNIGDVDVLTLPALPAGTNNIGDVDVASIAAGDNNIGNVDIVTMPNVAVAGTVAHDASTASNPTTTGGRAIAHGTNPTAVAAGDVTDGYYNRAGVKFTIGGHPNVVTVKHTNITTAVTDAAIVTVSSGLKIVVTAITVTLDNASTVFPTLLVGFGATTTPTTTGVILAHGGVPAGGGISRGDGSGILGIGGDGEDLRVTTTGNATGNGLQIVVTYFTIES